MCKDDYVYCTNCINGEVLINSIIENKPIPKVCLKCNPYYPEDSRPYRERPYYIFDSSS